MCHENGFWGVRTAQNVAEHCLSLLEPEIKVGMTERQIADCFQEICLSQSSIDTALTDSVASGPNTADPNHSAAERVIEPGDLILIDFSIVVNGWCGEMTRMYSIGQPSDEAQLICNIVSEAKKDAASLIHAGMTGAEAYQIAMNTISFYGYGKYFPHGLGHGIGLEMREAPSLSSQNEQPIPMGAVFSIAPGIYIPGLFGARLEDLYYLDADGIFCLNSSPAELKIL